jgi:hypothetical protein
VLVQPETDTARQPTDHPPPLRATRQLLSDDELKWLATR